MASMTDKPTPILFGHVVCDKETGGCGHGQPVKFHHVVDVKMGPWKSKSPALDLKELAPGPYTMTAQEDSYLVVIEPVSCVHCNLPFGRVQIGPGSKSYDG